MGLIKDRNGMDLSEAKAHRAVLLGAGDGCLSCHTHAPPKMLGELDVKVGVTGKSDLACLFLLAGSL